MENWNVGRVTSTIAVLFPALVITVVALALVSAVRQSAESGVGAGLFSGGLLVIALPFAIWSYALRVLRWHTLAKRLAPGLRLPMGAYTQIVGFAFSATPGRVAELYKLKILQDSNGVPVSAGMLAVVAERATDVIAFGSLVVVGALAGSALSSADVLKLARAAGPTVVGIAAGFTCLVIALLSLGRIRRALDHRLGRNDPADASRGAAAPPWYVRLALRLTRRLGLPTIFEQVQSGGNRLASPPALALALACVCFGRLGDAVVLWQIANHSGFSLAIADALLFIGVTGLVGGVSLAPGGAGAAEATLVGLLVAHALPLNSAIAVAIGTRALTFWLWVGLGLIVYFVGRRRQKGRETGEGPSTEHVPVSSP